MRRASTCLALLGCLAVLGLPAAASAAPTFTFKAKAVPIPKPGGGTYPHTGNILASKGGLGSALEANFVITGTGYGATPQNPAGGIPPLAAVNFFLPAGAKINSAGFPTCSEALLKNTGPTACKKAVASPVGNALGEVTFGSERVPEEAKLQAFFGPNKGLLFYVQGSSPVSLEFVSSGTYVNSGQAPYGLELKTTVPAIATVPGAALASTKNINVKVGAAIKKGKKLISYGTLPAKCPKGGFPVKAELIFGGSYGGEREFGIPAETVTQTYKAPCPPK
ncbi:MAG TPA: hypothetical protein VGO29_07640 [Solirubrobacteraceae bacterium]|jgi:hypothetical protein|nr:hypothetical protein [Solirubrobacteraceae bacterium]